MTIHGWRIDCLADTDRHLFCTESPGLSRSTSIKGRVQGLTINVVSASILGYGFGLISLQNLSFHKSCSYLVEYLLVDWWWQCFSYQIRWIPSFNTRTALRMAESEVVGIECASYVSRFFYLIPTIGKMYDLTVWKREDVSSFINIFC